MEGRKEPPSKEKLNIQLTNYRSSNSTSSPEIIKNIGEPDFSKIESCKDLGFTEWFDFAVSEKFIVFPVTESEHLGLKLLDINTFEEVTTLQVPRPAEENYHRPEYREIVSSPDKKYIIAIAISFPSPPYNQNSKSRLDVWNLEKKKLEKSVPIEGIVRTITWEDNNLLILKIHRNSSSQKNQEIEFNIRTKTLQERNSKYSRGYLSYVEAQPNKFLRCFSENKKFTIVNETTGTIIKTTELDVESIISISLSKDGRYAFIGSSDPSFIILDLQNDEIVFKEKRHAEKIFLINDNQLLVKEDCFTTNLITFPRHPLSVNIKNITPTKKEGEEKKTKQKKQTNSSNNSALVQNSIYRPTPHNKPNNNTTKGPTLRKF